MFTEGYSFPHPVLGLDDDITGEFNTTIEVGRNDADRKIKFYNISHEITNNYIQNLLQIGEAGILIKIYCSSTFKTWTLINPGESFELDENDVCNKVEIQVFVVVQNKISSYSDTSFNTHFSGYNFTVDGKEVIAISGKVILPIEKADEKLGIGNIFKFYSQEPSEPIRFRFNQNKIHIMYPKTENGDHPPNILFKTAPWTAYNLFIVPALTSMFQFIKDADKSEYEEYEWYTVINNLFPEDKRDDDPFVNAQRLLQKELPIINAYIESLKNNK